LLPNVCSAYWDRFQVTDINDCCNAFRDSFNLHEKVEPALPICTVVLLSMQKINTNTLAEMTWASPGGKFAGAGKEVSEALGRKPHSMDLNERHPFDVEILRIPPGKSPYPYHSHSAQWEFYHVISGRGTARDAGGMTSIEPGDAFLFKPGEAHQLLNDSQEDLVILVVADNPIGESCHYPDSNKWGVESPEKRMLRCDPLKYYDGEE
jgi:uncharacterized cupin superfamily protein